MFIRIVRYTNLSTSVFRAIVEGNSLKVFNKCIYVIIKIMYLKSLTIKSTLIINISILNLSVS